MNSTLQCLSNIEVLTNYFISNSFVADINTTNPLGMGGKLASSYSELLKNIWCKSDRYFTPWELKKII
jgi:ubiquitin carboxyl-terminal hydrolase 4/11